jgi:O-antigen ligase
MSGAVWVLIPKFGLWFTLFALLPSGLKMLGSRPVIERTPINWLVLVFLITALVGYWAAYDKVSAWIKFWLIVTSVLLYFSLSAQSKQYFGLLSLASFFLAFGVSIYFFLTGDFAVGSGRIAFWWMRNRPQVNLPDIHHGYISGLLAMTSNIATYWLWQVWNRKFNRFNMAKKSIIILVMAVIIWAFILTMSRGIWAAVAGAVGVVIIWKITASSRFSGMIKIKEAFPFVTLIILGAIITFVYLGPARADGDTTQSNYGTNTRAELQSRGTYFLADYPITGGGLNSFPGLYSQYMIVIPFFYFINSYNLFLDIGIEQGIVGGLAFFCIYLGSVWLVSKGIVISQSRQTRFIGWLCLLMLIVIIVHGLFYDYLYNGPITVLLFVPIGVSMGVFNAKKIGDDTFQLTKLPFALRETNIRILIYAIIVGAIVLVALNFSWIKSIWYANLGAVQMSQAELKDFPTNSWTGNEIVPALEIAEKSFHSSLQFDPDNRTANQRLGMIAMYRQDFESAVGYLEEAHDQAPDHRGIIKLLGYSYIWFGKIDMGQSLLSQIPEARDELNVYIWWWGTQGRNDLSENASLAWEKLSLVTSQP